MIKDILVHVPTERAMRPVIDASISLAKIFGAHLDAVALGYVSTGTVAYAFHGGAATAVAAYLERDSLTCRPRAWRFSPAFSRSPPMKGSISW